LERYRNGEHEKVWAELLALGGQVRQEPIFADALAVARETMTRARANIELLVPRLIGMGYRFVYRDRAFVPADSDTQGLVAEVEGRAGPLPLSLRAWCEVVGEVNFMGSYPKLSTYVEGAPAQAVAQGFLSLFAAQSGQASAPGKAGKDDSLRQAYELSRSLLDEVVRGIKTGQPRSPRVQAGVAASRKLLEQVQRPQLGEHPDVESDPLVVEPYFQDLEEELEQGEDESGQEDSGSFQAIIAPDATHKTNHSGGSPYCIRFPDAAVDAPLEGDENYGTFVEYLRIAFRWGGFPGLRASAKPPREELAYLTQGLSPL
jgi:hypothetical protein